MTRTSKILTAAAIALGVAAPVLANDQLIASAGLTQEQAAGMSLTEIAAYKFNRGQTSSELVTVSVQPGQGGDRSQLIASADVSGAASLNELAVAKINGSAARRDETQGIVRGSSVTVTSRSYGASAGRAQLIANAGLTPAEAQGLTLSEIAAYKFNRGQTNSEKQPVATWQ